MKRAKLLAHDWSSGCLVTAYAIHYLHNPIIHLFYPPPQKKNLHNYCLQVLLGHEDVLREIKNNAYANFWGVKEVYYGICASSESINCFSVTKLMTSRFEIVDEKYIEELKGKSENENTKNSTEYWKNVSTSGRMKETSKQL